MINWQLLVILIKLMHFTPEVDSWMQSVSVYFRYILPQFVTFHTYFISFSNFERTQSNFLTEETAVLHWNWWRCVSHDV